MKLYIWVGAIIVCLFINMYSEGFANNSLNLFANNRQRPSCKSTYSSDSGFVCLDNDQKYALFTRGGNRTNDAEF